MLKGAIVAIALLAASAASAHGVGGWHSGGGYWHGGGGGYGHPWHGDYGRWRGGYGHYDGFHGGGFRGCWSTVWNGEYWVRVWTCD